jgi:UDP-N-acetylmuramate--alanine ligase
MNIRDTQTIYMVGIKGFGMASLASVLAKMGKKISGSDVDKRFPTDDLLDELDIERRVGFDQANVPDDAQLVITTGAHGGLKNPEVLEAQEKGIPVLTHAEALGAVMDMFPNRISVCGCHGKTTASAMCAYVMHNMGLKLGYQVGVPTFSGLQGGDYTGGEYFVVESDEYVASPGMDNTPRFMYLNPNYALCLNIDMDHVDVYKDLESIKRAFKEFFEKILNQNGMLVYCRDDQNAHEVATSVEGLRLLSYGTDEGADVGIQIGDDGQHKVYFQNGDEIPFELSVPGRHNVLNASGVLALLSTMQLDVHEASKHLKSFHGAQLRFEVLFDSAEYTVINDYGHHPVEVKATIDAIRTTYSGRRLIVVFHPHTLSRTRYFKDAFIQELRKADQAFIMDIFASARDDNDGSLTSDMIVQEAQQKGAANIAYLPPDSALEDLHSQLRPHDVILFIGAGDKLYLYNKLIEKLS